MGSASDTEYTKAAVIEAAGELFAAHGFHGVTARKVAAKARVSLGAIPYHFGSMEALYRAVLVAACEVSEEAQPLSEMAVNAPPEQGLRLAVQWTIQDYAARKVAWPVKLIERESLDPSAAFREVLKRKFRPEWDWLCRVVGRAAALPDDSGAVKFGVITMHTLASTFMTHRRLLAEFAPDVAAAVDQPDALVDVLTKLTLDAVSRYAAAFAITNRRRRKHDRAVNQDRQ